MLEKLQKSFYRSIQKTIFVIISALISKTFRYWLLFFSSEKLCKSSLSTWGCYGDCKRSRNAEKFQASSRNSHHPSSVCNCEEFHEKPLFQNTSSTSESSTPPSWRPLLLFIPLRLGLTEVNPDYYRSLKVSSCS